MESTFASWLERIVYAREIRDSYATGVRVVAIHNQFCPNRYGNCICQYRGTLATRDEARAYARGATGWQKRAYWLGVARSR